MTPRQRAERLVQCRGLVSGKIELSVGGIPVSLFTDVGPARSAQTQLTVALAKAIEEDRADAEAHEGYVAAYLAQVVPEFPSDSAELAMARKIAEEAAVCAQNDLPLTGQELDKLAAVWLPRVIAQYDRVCRIVARLLLDEQKEAFKAGLEEGRRGPLALLREFEWSIYGEICPVCHGRNDERGHFKDCRMEAFLKESKT